MKKKKTTIPSIIKWVIALILVVMQVYPFFYVFTSSFKSLDDFRTALKLNLLHYLARSSHVVVSPVYTAFT